MGFDNRLWKMRLLYERIKWIMKEKVLHIIRKMPENYQSLTDFS